MRPDRVRIVPEESLTEEQLYPLFVKHDWGIRRRIARNGDQPLEAIYFTHSDTTNIHFIIDHKIGVNYLLVSGPEAPQIATTLRCAVFHYPSSEIIDNARRRIDRLALYRLALDKMEHGFDPETFEIYTRALRDPDPIVRGAAVLGAAYLGWPELAAPLRALAGPGEPDASIRRDATILASRLQRVRIVLAPGVGEDDLAPLIVKYNWSGTARYPQRGDQPREYVYATDDGATTIHFIMDHQIDVTYLLVTGPDTPQIAQLLRENLLQHRPAVILRRAREPDLSPEDRRRALHHLALDKMEQGFDQETFEIYTRALRDPDPVVRGAAVLGAAYLGWPELRALAG